MPAACPPQRSTCFLALWSHFISPILVSVSPAGHEEQCRPTCGCAVRGSALAGRAVPAVHAGGGTADDPQKAAILRVFHLTSSGGPEPTCSALQPHLFRKPPAQGRGVHLPSPELPQIHRTPPPKPSLDLAPLSGLSTLIPYFTRQPAGMTGGQDSPTVKKQCVFWVFLLACREGWPGAPEPAAVRPFLCSLVPLPTRWTQGHVPGT